MPTDKIALDFTSLSSNFRVLPISPAWSTVEPALARLDQMRKTQTAYPELDGDIRCVDEFARVLRRNHRSVAAALLCGAVIGRASNLADPGQRLQHGLRLISTAYRFDEKRESNVARDLLHLRDQLEKRWEWPAAHFKQVDAVTLDDLTAWKTVLQAALGAIGNQKIEADAGKVQSSLQKQLEHYFNTGTPAEPDLDSLLGLAAGLPLSLLIKPDPRKMTIADWSAALLAGLEEPTSPDAPHCPLWLSVASLHALGFFFEAPPPAETFRRWLEKSLRFAKRQLPFEPLPSWPWLRSGGASSAVLLVKAPTDSLFDTLLPSPDYAAVAVSPQQAEQLWKRRVSQPVLQPRPEGPPLGPPLELVAFEAAAVNAESAQELLAQLSAFSNDARHVYVYPQAPPPDEPPGPYIASAPTKLEDLFVRPRKSARRNEAL